MAMTRQSIKKDSIIMRTIEELVPQEHDVRKLDSCMDWDFIYPLVKDLYIHQYIVWNTCYEKNM